MTDKTKTKEKPLTVRLVAEHLSVGVDTVLAWIRTMRLEATNISMTTNRPRWRIKREALDEFLEARSNLSKGKRPAAKRRPPKPVKKYV